MSSVIALDSDHLITRGTYAGLGFGRGHVTLNRLNAPPLEIKPAFTDQRRQVVQCGTRSGNCCRPTAKPLPLGRQRDRDRAGRRVASVTPRRRSPPSRRTCSDPDDLPRRQRHGRGAHDLRDDRQRFDAAVALRPEKIDGHDGRIRYLIDGAGPDGPEFVIRVSDLAKAARGAPGGSLERGRPDLAGHFGNPKWAPVELRCRVHQGRQGRIHRPGHRRGGLPRAGRRCSRSRTRTV